MIKVIAGGKKPAGWEMAALEDYGRRLRKPFETEWQFLAEEKLQKHLLEWPFEGREFVILCDERGVNISSPEFSKKLADNFAEGRKVVILIGGAYGFSEEDRKRADFVWSFSKLVLPHGLARILVSEQIYRAQEIWRGSAYHHE